MTASPAVVVAAWGAGNAVLTAVLAGFGAKPSVVWMYGGAVIVIELFALSVWWARRRRDTRTWNRASNGDSVLLFALGVLVAGLGWIFNWLLALAAIVPFYGAILREISVRRGNT